MSANASTSGDGTDRELYRLRRSGTIALMLVIVLALVGAGLLAGALAGQNSRPAGPGGTSDFKITSPNDAGVLGIGRVRGSRKLTAEAMAARLRVTGGLGAGRATLGAALFQLSPTPSESPTASPIVESPIVESPSPAPVGGEGVFVPIDGGTVFVPLPEGWSQIVGGSNYTLNFDGVEGYLYAEVDSGLDPSTDAASLITQVYQNFIVADTNYSQLSTGDVEPYQPFGGIVSRAGLSYDGLWADTQGAYGFGGKMWLGIRNDGKAFLMTLEIYPGDDWDAGINNACTPVYQPSWESFAGEPFPYDPCAG